MNEIVEQFLSLPLVIYCLVIWALVWVQRRGVEVGIPSIKTKKFWTEFLVPLGPLGTGALLAAALPMYPFPEMFVAHWTGRAAVGLACGLVSGLVFRIVKKALVEKLGQLATKFATKKEDAADSSE